MRVLLVVIILTAAGVADRKGKGSPEAGVEPGRVVASEEAEIVPGEILVETRSGSSLASLAAGYGAAVAVTRGAVHLLSVARGEERGRAEQLQGDPNVVAAAPNYRRHAQIVPNDTYYRLQWGLSRIGAPSAWEVTIGSPAIVIAILDTGVDLQHRDLIPKLVPGANTLGVDPSAVSGSCRATTTEDDDRGHGTHVAGIAAGTTNNASGIAGTSWGARIMPVKVLDCTGGGSDAQIVAGIDYAVGHGARVINLSIGGPGRSTILDAAVARAVAANVILVAAAGNTGSTVPFYPAASPGAIAVGATDQTDQLASFSNRGSYIALSAPGVGILSTWPLKDPLFYGPELGLNWASGTSAASPFVAGLASLVLSAHPDYRPMRVLSTLAGSADRIDCSPVVAGCAYDASGHSDYYGSGRINAARAMRTAAVNVMPLVPRAGRWDP